MASSRNATAITIPLLPETSTSMAHHLRLYIYTDAYIYIHAGIHTMYIRLSSHESPRLREQSNRHSVLHRPSVLQHRQRIMHIHLPHIHTRPTNQPTNEAQISPLPSVGCWSVENGETLLWMRLGGAGEGRREGRKGRKARRRRGDEVYV